MSKRPGSKSGIGVNYRPPGYRAVARRVDVAALEAGAAKPQQNKPQQKKNATLADPPDKPAQPDIESSGKAPSPDPGNEQP
jgi:hypothetical protein